MPVLPVPVIAGNVPLNNNKFFFVFFCLLILGGTEP
jgi:hypothetical protein